MPEQLVATLADVFASNQPTVLVPGLFEIDGIGVFVLLLCLVGSALVLLSAPGTPSTFHYVAIFGFFVIVAVAVVSAANLVVFLIAWELAALFAWGLARIGIEGGGELVSIVPFQASGLIGTVLMMFAIMVIWSQADSLAISQAGSALVRPLAGWLMLAATFFKLHGVVAELSHPVVPDTFTISPALIVTTAVPMIAIYPLLRFVIALPVQAAPWHQEAAWATLAVALAAALVALGSDDVLRSVAAGLISQIALIANGLLLGYGEATTAAVALTVTATLGWSGLLLALAPAQAIAGHLRLGETRGMLPRVPLAALLYLVCAAALAGLPLIIGLGSGHTGIGTLGQVIGGGDRLGIGLWIGAIVATFAYLWRIFGTLFLGAPSWPRAAGWHAIGYAGAVAIVIALIAFGYFSPSTLEWSRAIAGQLD